MKTINPGIGRALTRGILDNAPRGTSKLLAAVVDKPDLKDEIQRAMDNELLGDGLELAERPARYEME